MTYTERVERDRQLNLMRIGVSVAFTMLQQDRANAITPQERAAIDKRIVSVRKYAKEQTKLIMQGIYPTFTKGS